jgi:thiamine biosynthesis lipoprotein
MILVVNRGIAAYYPGKQRSTPALWFLPALLFLLVGCSKPGADKLQGSTMGTSYSVVIPHLPDGDSEEAIQEDIESLLEGVNRQMSTYLPDSELSRINQSEANVWLDVSPELFAIIRQAISISQQTDAAFDITVGPLVNLWGFGPTEGPNTNRPTEEAVESARALVGYQHIELDLKNRRLRKPFKDLYVDLSAIAKGYGVDAIANYLDSLGIRDYLVEIGGELRGKGLSPRGDSWRVAVERPESGQRQVHKVLNVSDIAIATSGDYRNFYEYDGVRFSHTIDPRTGMPVTHSLASVTVLSKQAVIADAWATALMVLGEQAGFELAEQKGVAAYFLYQQGDEFLSLETAAFKRLTSDSE